MNELLSTLQEGQEGTFHKFLEVEIDRVSQNQQEIQERIRQTANEITQKKASRGSYDSDDDAILDIDILSIDLSEIQNLSNINGEINALQNQLQHAEGDERHLNERLQNLSEVKTNLQNTIPANLENVNNGLGYFDNRRINNIRKTLIAHIQDGTPVGPEFIAFLSDQLIEQAVETNLEELIAEQIKPDQERLDAAAELIRKKVLAVRGGVQLTEIEIEELSNAKLTATELTKTIAQKRRDFFYGFENADQWENYVRTTAQMVSAQVSELNITNIVETIPRLALIEDPNDYAELVSFNIPSLSLPELVEILELDGRNFKEVEAIFKTIRQSVAGAGGVTIPLKERYSINGRQQDVLTKYGIAHFLKELNTIRKVDNNDSSSSSTSGGNRGQIKGIGYSQGQSDEASSEPVSLVLFSLNNERDSLAGYIQILNRIEGDATRIKLEGLSLEEDVERTLYVDARLKTARFKAELPSATRLFKGQPLGIILNPSNLPLAEFFDEAVERYGVIEGVHYVITDTGRYTLYDSGIHQLARVMLNQKNIGFVDTIMTLSRQAGINPDDYGDDFEELTLITLKRLEKAPEYVPFPTHTAISMALEVDEYDLSNGFLNPKYKQGRQQAAPLLLTSQADINNPFIIKKAQVTFSNAKNMLHNTNTSGWLVASGEEYAADALYKLSRAYARAAANMDDEMQEYVYGIAQSIENTAQALAASPFTVRTEDFIERILISGANEFQTPQIEAIANAVGDEALDLEKFRIIIASSQLKRTQHFILDRYTDEILLSRTVVNRMRELIALNERPEGTRVNLLLIFNQIAEENIAEQRQIRKRRSLSDIAKASDANRSVQPTVSESITTLAELEGESAILEEEEEEVYFEEEDESQPVIVDFLAIMETGDLQERIVALEIVTESEIRKAAALINRELENLIMYVVEANQEGIPANTGRERAISTIINTVRSRSKREANDKWREILVNNIGLVEDISNAIYDEYFDHEGKFYSNFSKAITGKIPVHHMLSILDITSLDDREARYLVEDLRKRTVARGKGTQGTNNLNTAEEVFRYLLSERPENRNLSEQGLTETLESMLRYGYHLQPKDINKQVELELARFESTKSLNGLAQITIKQILSNPGKHLTNLSFEQIREVYVQIPLGLDFKPTREMLQIEIEHFRTTRDFASLSINAKHVILNNLDKILANYTNNEIESLFWSLSEDLQKKYENKFSEFIAEREKSVSADSDEDSSDDLIIEDDELDDINIFDKIRATINDELDLSHIAEQIDQSLYNSNPYVKNLVQRLVKNPVHVTSRMKRIEIPGQVEFYSYGLKGSSYRIILEQNPNSTYKVVFLGTHRDYEKVILNLKKKL